MDRRNAELTRRALAAWQGVERLELLGPPTPDRLPIFSFRVRDGKGGYVHQQLVTRMLSDRFGIQARGGCACAGPYVHRLLSIGPEDSERMRQAILAGDEFAKPGFTPSSISCPPARREGTSYRVRRPTGTDAGISLPTTNASRRSIFSRIPPGSRNPTP